MRAAAILGPGASPKDLAPFQRDSGTTWLSGLPVRSSDADAILIFGGDGTVHRYLAQLVELHLPVLVVPCGSGNDFARALGLRNLRDSLAAWRHFAFDRSNVRYIDLGVITAEAAGSQPRYFCTAGGVGLACDVARRANRLPRWLRGNGGYALSLPPVLMRYEPTRAKFEAAGRPSKAPARHEPIFLAAFANAPFYGGGMRIAPRAQLDDGKLDICLVHDLHKLKLLFLFPTVYAGRHLSVAEVEYFQTETITVGTEKPADVYADGEFVCQTPAKIHLAAGALQVISSMLR